MDGSASLRAVPALPLGMKKQIEQGGQIFGMCDWRVLSNGRR
jgi:hypothetical protein